MKPYREIMDGKRVMVVVKPASFRIPRPVIEVLLGALLYGLVYLATRI